MPIWCKQCTMCNKCGRLSSGALKQRCFSCKKVIPPRSEKCPYCGTPVMKPGEPRKES